MKKIGLFYATKAERTSWVAEKIQKEFGEDKIEVVPIEQAWQNDFAAYDCFIVGASTWFDGELPTYWDELLPELRTMKLKGRRLLSSVWEIRYAIRKILQMESGCWQKSLKGMRLPWSVLLLPKVTLSNVQRLYVASSGAGWLSIWIISLNRRKRKSKHGANRSKKSSRNDFISLYKIVTLSDANSDGICLG